jgi:hypothetical protein
MTKPKVTVKVAIRSVKELAPLIASPKFHQPKSTSALQS